MCLVQWKKAKKTELPLTKAACNRVCLDSKLLKAAFSTPLILPDTTVWKASSGWVTRVETKFRKTKQHVQKAVYLSVPDTASGMRRIMLPAQTDSFPQEE